MHSVHGSIISCDVVLILSLPLGHHFIVQVLIVATLNIYIVFCRNYSAYLFVTRFPWFTCRTTPCYILSHSFVWNVCKSRWKAFIRSFAVHVTYPRYTSGLNVKFLCFRLRQSFVNLRMKWNVTYVSFAASGCEFRNRSRAVTNRRQEIKSRPAAHREWCIFLAHIITYDLWQSWCLCAWWGRSKGIALFVKAHSVWKTHLKVMYCPNIFWALCNNKNKHVQKNNELNGVMFPIREYKILKCFQIFVQQLQLWNQNIPTTASIFRPVQVYPVQCKHC